MKAFIFLFSIVLSANVFLASAALTDTKQAVEARNDRLEALLK